MHKDLADGLSPASAKSILLFPDMCSIISCCKELEKEMREAKTIWRTTKSAFRKPSKNHGKYNMLTALDAPVSCFFRSFGKPKIGSKLRFRAWCLSIQSSSASQGIFLWAPACVDPRRFSVVCQGRFSVLVWRWEVGKNVCLPWWKRVLSCRSLFLLERASWLSETRHGRQSTRT